MKILLAIDNSQCSESGVKAVLEQMRPEGSEVCILHAVKPLLIIPLTYIGRVDSLAAAQQIKLKEGKELVELASQLLRKAGFTVYTDVEEGDPQAAIINYAARWHADLIVMGSHGKKGLDKALIGSVSETVLRHAHCSVEIVRPTKVHGAATRA